MASLPNAGQSCHEHRSKNALCDAAENVNQPMLIEIAKLDHHIFKKRVINIGELCPIMRNDYICNLLNKNIILKFLLNVSFSDNSNSRNYLFLFDTIYRVIHRRHEVN